MNRRRVAITGLGLVSPYGGNLAGFFARLCAGDWTEHIITWAS